jgi:hypothetical protein
LNKQGNDAEIEKSATQNPNTSITDSGLYRGEKQVVYE